MRTSATSWWNGRRRGRAAGWRFLSGLIRHAGSLQVRSGGELAVVAELADPAAARLAFSMLRDAAPTARSCPSASTASSGETWCCSGSPAAAACSCCTRWGCCRPALAPLQRPPARLLARRCCRGSYLRGAFVAAGSVAAPRRPAHLELRTAELDAAEALAETGRRDDIPLRAAARRGHAIAYLKSRDDIRDLLALIGAHDAVLSFEEAEVISATREAANRLTNCDRANLARTGAAAHRQREAIALLDLDLLDPRLRQVAELRLANPTSSLAELGECCEPAADQVGGRPFDENPYFPYRIIKYPSIGGRSNRRSQRS